MHLVVVESPTKARKLSQYLGKEYVVEASRGHVRDLPKSQLGVDVENNFSATYEPIHGSAATIKKLKSLAKKADHLYLATDPDREGEAIAWHLLEAWDDQELVKKSQRAVFHEITKEAVIQAIEHPKEINGALVDAQQARRVLDRLVGYKLSPVLWKKIRRGLSAGRVQSVALRLIVEREDEIEAFKPEEYWEVDLRLSTEGNEIISRIISVNGQKYEPHSEADVTSVKSWAPTAHYMIKAVDKAKRSRTANPPFITSTLQQAAASRLGYSAKRTMQLAQQLYEEGLITYHRTDSTNLSKQSVEMAREYIEQTFGSDYLPKSANVYKSKSKNAQEAHEAIRPTAALSSPSMPGKLTEAHAKLYDLIFRRFIASQMTAAQYDLTTIIVVGSQSSEKLEARTSGSIIVHPGWMKLFPGGEDTILPSVQEGQVLNFEEFLSVQKFTQPPPRYNDASLVKELEKRDIGRPSTYASIISVIMQRGYVEKLARAFVPTAIGKTVIYFLKQNFPEVVDYAFTANMEEELDEISRGEKKWQKVMKEFYGPFSTKLGDVEDTATRMQVPVEPMNKPCPKCGVTEAAFAKLAQKKQTLMTMPAAQREGLVLREQPHGELVIRTGRFGKFISCSRYPECDFTDKFLEKIDMPCPECGEGDVVVKKTKKGRTFYGCSRYPKCEFASWQKPGSTEEAE